jgi:hypothetical protein
MARGQASLFDDVQTPVTAGLVALPGSEKALSAQQRRFNTLIAQINGERERLAAWEAAVARFQTQAAAELPPRQARLRAQQRRLVVTLDQLLATADQLKPKLTRRRRDAVRDALTELVAAMLENGPDVELAALHDKHADISLAEQAQWDAEIAREMFAQVFGDAAVPEGEHGSVDEFMAAAHERLAERARAQQERAEAASARRASRRKAQGKAPGKKEREAQALALAREQAGQSLRQVFRKLASQLHPDRAVDAADRVRRTGLMQRVNQAYEANDLLAMLTLQLETEQIDHADLAALPEERLLHYNLVLQEQLDTLRQQIGECAAPFMQGRRGVPSPSRAQELLAAQVAEIEAVIRGIDADLAVLADPRQRIGLIDTWVAQAAQDDPDDAAIAMFSAMMAGPSPRRRTRR